MSAEPLYLPTHPGTDPTIDLDRTVETAVVDLVALRRSIGGMEEELRVLRQRIAAAEASDDGESPGSDFARRSTLLAHRMTTELLASGRADIRRAVDDAERSAAQRVEMVREEARRLLDGVRRELADALDERSLTIDQVVESATTSGHDGTPTTEAVAPGWTVAPTAAPPLETPTGADERGLVVGEQIADTERPEPGPPMLASRATAVLVAHPDEEIAEILAALTGPAAGGRPARRRRNWRKVELLVEMVVAAVLLVLAMVSIR